MAQKIRTQMVFSFMAVGLLTAFFINTLGYLYLYGNTGFVKQRAEANKTLGEMGRKFLADNALDENEREALDKAGKESSSGVKLTAKGKIIFDNTGEQQKSPYTWKGSRVNRVFKIDSGIEMQLRYIRPYFFNEQDESFNAAFNRFLMASTLLALIAAIIPAPILGWRYNREIKKANELSLVVLKGSLANPPGGSRYEEFQPLFNNLQALKEKLQKQEQLKKRMTSDFAHELRTPLTTLQTHLEALIDGVWEPSKERFVSCHDEILRLIRLVGSLEQLSKYEAEGIVLNKTRFDLKELINSIFNNFAPEFHNKKVGFHFSGDEQIINADKDKISQLVINLFSNSLKYTNPGGSVFVSISGDESYVYLVLNDNGEGIPPGDIDHIFKRLYRSDQSRARASGGAGIGLAIAKSIVEAHKGSVEVVSQEKLGTEFTIILPRN